MATRFQADLDKGICNWFSAAGLPIKASYRVTEVCKLLSISERTAYNMIADGRLRSFALYPSALRGKSYRIPLDVLSDIYAASV